tara:strand:- start:925 stop:1476 length:552 start_codon:yes stop_codon:yes gene_type:complete
MSITLNKGVNKLQFDSNAADHDVYRFPIRTEFQSSGTAQLTKGVTVWSKTPVQVYGYDPTQNPDDGDDAFAQNPSQPFDSGDEGDQFGSAGGPGWILLGTTSADSPSVVIPSDTYKLGVVVPVSGVADVRITPMLKPENAISISTSKTVDALSDVPPFTQHDIKKVLMVNDEGKLEWTSIRPI